MNAFVIFALLINICNSQYISVHELRQMMNSNYCCPDSINYDPCCTISINSTTYLGQKLRDYYSISPCCGEDDSCVMNLTTCSNCTHLCTNSPMSSYDSTTAKVEISSYRFNNQSYAKINISITDVSRKLSGLQFNYNTNGLYLATRDTHLEHYLTYINNGLYVASEPSQYFTIVP